MDLWQNVKILEKTGDPVGNVPNLDSVLGSRLRLAENWDGSTLFRLGRSISR